MACAGFGTRSCSSTKHGPCFQGLSWQLPMLHPKSSLLEACPKWCVSSEGTEAIQEEEAGGRREGGGREARGSPALRSKRTREAPVVGKAQTASRLGLGAGRLMGAQRAWSATHYPVLKPRSSVWDWNSRSLI